MILMEPISQIADQFKLNGKVVDISAFGSGHIHQTYFIKTEPAQNDDYIIQLLNTNVFRDPDAVVQNISLVTSHILDKLRNAGETDLKRRVLHPVDTVDGKLKYTDSENRVWRCFIFIPDHKSFDRAVNEHQVYEGGKAFGKFLADLSDLPVSRIKDTIPDFHNLDWRLRQFNDALSNGVRARIKETEPEINMLKERQEEMRTIRILGSEGKIPLRIVHHDTKINNVLYSKDEQALCVIDLDTVMPGYVHDDFGDAIRTFTNTGEEDDADLNRISMNIRYFRAFTEGFLGVAGPMLNASETEYLALSARVMTYMQVLRFLTDYINGDTYYRIHHPGHNLQRTRAQMKLLFSMEEQYGEMKKIVEEVTISPAGLASPEAATRRRSRGRGRTL
jgi:Ser/Thr protein kinase RdoA (MazF antagonist)